MYKLLLSLRYFRSRFLALASVLAITFGVAMLVVVLGLMGGYLIQLQETIRGTESHLQVRGRGPFGVPDDPEIDEVILSVDNVAATSPFIERLGVYHALSFQPCRLEGIDPRRQLAVGDFGHYVLRPRELEGILERFAPGRGDGPPADGGPDAGGRGDRRVAVRAVDELIRDPERSDLSAEELENLFSREWREELIRRSDPVLLELLDGEIPPAALVGIQLLLDREMELGTIITFITMSPGSEKTVYRDFVVTGALKTGDFKQDLRSIYAELDLVKNFLGLCDADEGVCRYQGIRVALHDPGRLDETRKLLAAELGSRFPDLVVSTWRELKRNLLKAVLIEKFLVYFLVLILVLFTGSMILLMLLLTVIEKTRDIGILIALGASPSGVTSIFLVNGMVISFAGTVLGLGLGLAFCAYINDIHDAIYDVTGWSLFKAEIYQMDRIPMAFEPTDILLSAIPPIIIGLMASVIPALWAARRDPIKAIQYE